MRWYCRTIAAQLCSRGFRGRALKGRQLGSFSDFDSSCVPAQWYLYLVTPLVGDNTGVKPAYRRISPVVRELQDDGSWINVFNVKVVGPTEATGEAIAQISRQNRPGKATRYGGASLGELSIDGAYVYPPVPTPATS